MRRLINEKTDQWEDWSMRRLIDKATAEDDRERWWMKQGDEWSKTMNGARQWMKQGDEWSKAMSFQMSSYLIFYKIVGWRKHGMRLSWCCWIICLCIILFTSSSASSSVTWRSQSILKHYLIRQMSSYFIEWVSGHQPWYNNLIVTQIFSDLSYWCSLFFLLTSLPFSHWSLVRFCTSHRCHLFCCILHNS